MLILLWISSVTSSSYSPALMHLMLLQPSCSIGQSYNKAEAVAVKVRLGPSSLLWTQLQKRWCLLLVWDRRINPNGSSARRLVLSDLHSLSLPFFGGQESSSRFDEDQHKLYHWKYKTSRKSFVMEPLGGCCLCSSFLLYNH